MYTDKKKTKQNKKSKTCRLDCYSAYIHSFYPISPKLHEGSIFPFPTNVGLGHETRFGQWDVDRSDSHSLGLKRYHVFPSACTLFFFF